MGRWHCVDKLAEKYIFLSPYNYCANNPIIYVDPDRKKIIFATGSTQNFKDDFNTAAQYLKDNGAGNIITELEKHPYNYYIKEGLFDNKFDPGSMTIVWFSDMGINTNEDHDLSSVTILNHEADLANQYMIEYRQ